MIDVIRPKNCTFNECSDVVPDSVSPTQKDIVVKELSDFYKGKSFRWAGDWESNRLYSHDEYHVDFVKYHEKVWVCTKSHYSIDAPDQMPEYWNIALECTPDIDNTIIIDYDWIAELKASEENDDVRHPEIAELVLKIITEQDKLILVRTMKDKYEGTNPTYYVPDTNYSYGEFGETIGLYASYTGISDGSGRQRHESIVIELEGDGKIWEVKSEISYILSEKSVVDKLTSKSSTLPLSAKQGRVLKQELDKKSNSDGYYPKMSVGFAGNLVGREVATAGQFTYRASAGKKSIGDEGARIKRIKGNTVVWNQLIPILDSDASISKNGITVKDNRNGTYTISTDAGGATANTWLVIGTKTLIKAGHKYIIQGGYSNSLAVWGSGGYAATADTKGGTIIQGLDGVTYYGPTIFVRSGFVATTPITIRPQITDLTQMFTSGNKPTSVEDFYACIPSGVDIHAYKEGEIISMNTEAIKTVGFNQWDEKWEVGGLNQSTGLNYDGHQDRIRSKNYVQVISGQDYYFCSPSEHAPYVYMYDSEFNFVSWIGLYSTRIFTIPSGVSYIRFYIAPSYGTVYNNDICINLSHTAYKNGTYSHYRTFTRQLPDLGVMRSAGNAFDEIRFNVDTQKWEKVTRIGEVDLGSLPWESEVQGGRVGFFARIKVVIPPADSGAKVNMLCAKLTTVIQYGNFQYANDKVIFANANGWLQAADHRYTDATSFKSAMQGVMLYYELAEPITDELDWPADTNLDYAVEDFGTEEAISSVPSAPFSADINYPFNAVDTIRANEREIQALKTAIQQMSAAMSINHEE